MQENYDCTGKPLSRTSQAEGCTFRIAQPSPTADKLADRLDDIVKRTCGGIQAAQLLNCTLSPPNNTHSCASRKNFFCKFSTVLSFVLTILLWELSPSKHHSALNKIIKRGEMGLSWNSQLHYMYRPKYSPLELRISSMFAKKGREIVRDCLMPLLHVPNRNSIVRPRQGGGLDTKFSFNPSSTETH